MFALREKNIRWLGGDIVARPTDALSEREFADPRELNVAFNWDVELRDMMEAAGD